MDSRAWPASGTPATSGFRDAGAASDTSCDVASLLDNVDALLGGLLPLWQPHQQAKVSKSATGVHDLTSTSKKPNLLQAPRFTLCNYTYRQ